MGFFLYFWGVIRMFKDIWGVGRIVELGWKKFIISFFLEVIYLGVNIDI